MPTGYLVLRHASLKLKHKAETYDETQDEQGLTPNEMKFDP